MNGFSTAPFWPVFGVGAPGAAIPTNQLYFDTNTPIYVPYVYQNGGWHEFGDGVGAVTSVGLSLPASVFTVTGSPVVSAGVLTGAFNAQTANTFFRGPVTGAAGAPVFGGLVVADFTGLFTSGSVLFASTTGAITQNNAAFFWDNTNGRLGIGTAVPTQALDILATNIEFAFNTIAGVFQATRDDATAVGPQFIFRKGRGTIAAPTVILTNDTVFSISGRGYTGSGTTYTQGAAISAQLIDPTPSTTAMGMRLFFSLAAIGAVTNTEVARLEVATGLSMFGANPVINANRLFVMRQFTVATLPTGTNPNSVATVTDSTVPYVSANIGATPLGGGANKCKVTTFDGTNWVIG